MDASQQESCGLSVLSMCRGVTGGLGRHGQGEGARGYSPSFSLKRGRGDIRQKGHCSFNSQKLRLLHCQKSKS